MMREIVRSGLRLVVAIVVGLSSASCGGARDPLSANLQPGDMPSGETWSGVYYHPVFGYLHMVEQGSNVVGRWKRTDQSAWGELSGTKIGNVLRYSWREHRYGLVGAAAEHRGKGYFVYKAGNGGISQLDGQYGLDADEAGSDWHCVKQMRLEPDLNSIKGDLGGTAPPAAQKWE
jgi:hypothetical protein